MTSNKENLWRLIESIESHFERDMWSYARSPLEWFTETVEDMEEEGMISEAEKESLKIQASDVRHELDRPHFDPAETYDRFLNLKSSLRRIVGER